MPRLRRWSRIAWEEYASSARTTSGLVRGRAGSAQVGHGIGEGRHPRLSGGENEREGPTTVVGGEVDRGGVSAEGPVDGVVVRLAVGGPFVHETAQLRSSSVSVGGAMGPAAWW